MLKKITSSFLAVLLIALLMTTNIVLADATQVADNVVINNLKYTLYSEGETRTATNTGYSSAPTDLLY